jgi:hypothetical protein
MAKRQADTDLEKEFSVNSPASKKLRFAETDSRNGHLSGREWEQDEHNHQDILAAADLEAAELQEAAQDQPESPEREEEDDDEEEEALLAVPQRQSQPVEGYGDLYLDTINRAVLDFDFEKLCSVSLSNINVYACLVCGKYFQGRGNKSHAYFHALEIGHHVFVNMETKKVYVLPEGYEVKSKSLDDIKYVVDPTFTKNDVLKLDKEVRDAWDLLGKKYRPGKNSLPQMTISITDLGMSCRIRWNEQYQSERLFECCCSGPCARHADSQFFPPPKFPGPRIPSTICQIQHSGAQTMEPESLQVTRVTTRTASRDCPALFKAVHPHSSVRPC